MLAELLCRNELAALDLLSTEVQLNKQEKSKTRQKRKFDALLRSTQQWNDRPRAARNGGTQSDSDTHPKWVVSLSSRSLSTAEQAILGKGLNFAPAPSRIPAARIVAAVESGLRRVPEELAEAARTTVVGAITKARAPTVNLLPQERRAIKNLQKGERILVLPADKEWATVVMDRAEYDGKMSSLLDDPKMY